MWTLGFLILLSLSLGVGAWLLFVWSVRSGQYDDPEGPKYRMLDEDDDRGDRGEPGARAKARGKPARDRVDGDQGPR